MSKLIIQNPPIEYNSMITDLSNRDYHSFGGLSSTKFPLMRLSNRAFDMRNLFDFSKAVFNEGNLMHDCVLTPHLVEDGYVESPTKGLDTIKAKQCIEDNPHRIVVGQGQMKYWQDLAPMIHLMFPFIKTNGTHTEVSFFHKDVDSGLTFQVRPDIYNPTIGMLYDLKSTKANNHKEFEKLIEEYDYDLSLAFYVDVLLLCGYENNLEYTGWLCVPKSAPHIPFVFKISEELLEKGRNKYRTLLENYIEYKKLDENNLNVIYQDVANNVAHSWEYRKKNY